MSRLLLVPLDDIVVFPNMNVTLTVEVGDEDNVLLVPKHEGAAFFAFAYPSPDGFADGNLDPAAAHWDAQLGEYVLEWEDIRESPDPRAVVLEFARSAFRHACTVCDWDPVLAATAEGVPPPIR